MDRYGVIAGEVMDAHAVVDGFLEGFAGGFERDDIVAFPAGALSAAIELLVGGVTDEELTDGIFAITPTR